MKLCEKVAPQADKNKRHSRDDINSESRSAYAKRFEKRRVVIAVMTVTVRSWVLSLHISAEAVHDHVLFLSRARIVNFITRKKFPPSVPFG